MKRKQVIFIGLTFVIAIAVFIWGYNFLKGKDIFNKQITFYAKYHHVSGLTRANPVLINGLRVGQVRTIYFDPDMSGDIIAVIVLNTKFPIPRNSTASIYSADLMGSKAINLVLGDSPELLQEGDTLQSSIEASLKDEVNAQVQPIKLKAENLLASIDTLVIAFQSIFNESARENLKESFNDIRQTFSNLQSTTSNIDTLVDSEVSRVAAILENIDSLTATLSKNRHQISAIISNFEQVSDSLANTDIPGTFNRANKTLDDLDAILASINSGQGTLGMLLHNDTLYIELNKSAEELNLLLKDLRENPKRYVKFSLF
ncbi:MAG: MlaD family protein [Bacteroidales bacterium]|nr:MlaD family protein [Bacteroidales bacterium]MCF6341812.1 MlaD family protein [Bacteroidales bacterium]